MPTSTELGRIAEAVANRLATKPDASPLDVYVWADGSVTGPPEGDERSDERAVAVFSPGDSRLTPAEIRASIARGLAVVDPSDHDAVAAPVRESRP